MTTSTSEDALATAWGQRDAGDAAIVEFGLGHEFMLPLAENKLDPFIGLVAGLNELRPGQLGLFQILFEPVQNDWAENIERSLNFTDGRPLFVNAPELTKHGQEKVRQPLYAAVVRIATRAADFDSAWEIARDMASALRVFAHPQGNELIPLHNHDYPFEVHQDDVLLRQSHRSGMILTLDELTGFVHLPSKDVPKLARQMTKTRAAPKDCSDALVSLTAS